jgi:Protein of unknown function (DUF3141)
MEMIELMPPGLYEATITEVGSDTQNRELVDGKYLFRLEARTLDDIRAFGVNGAEDDKRFATVARVSEINLGLYRTLAQPYVRAVSTEAGAEAMRAMHPNRVRFGVFSDENPFMQPVKSMAVEARARRRPVSTDNPFLAWEKAASDWIGASLQSWGEVRDAMTEATFLTTYGSPLLQAVVGLNAEPAAAPRRVERDVERERAAVQLLSSLENRFEAGGAEEGALRALLYIRRPEGAADERGFRLAKIIRDSKKANERLTLAQFRDMLREQVQLLRTDEERAVKALPKLIHPGEPDADAALDALRKLIAAPGALSKESKARAARLEKLLGVKLAAA